MTCRWIPRVDRRCARLAFSLVEVTIAMGLVSFVMVVLVGLAGRALSSSRESKERVAASNVAVSILQSWATNPAAPPGQPPIDALDLSTLAPGEAVQQDDILIDQNGEPVASESDAAFRLEYRISRPSAGPKQVLVWMRVSWPAAVDGDAPAASAYELVHSIQL